MTREERVAYRNSQVLPLLNTPVKVPKPVKVEETSPEWGEAVSEPVVKKAKKKGK